MASKAIPSARSRWALLALLLCLVGVAGVLTAAEPAIKVSVVAILASEKGDRIDERLREIAQEVQRVDPRLSSFRMVKMNCKSVTIGNKDTFDLVADQTATVTVEQREKDGRVQLKVAPPLLGEITYMTTCGKFLPIVTRFRTKNNELLILAVRVQPCPGKK
jgi:hypothetical protein